MSTKTRGWCIAAAILGVGLIASACSEDDGNSGTAGQAGSPAQGGASQGGSGQGGAVGGSGQGGAAGSGQGGSSTGGASGAAGSSSCQQADQHAGDGTYYAATGAGNCSFPETPDDLLVGAMNQTDYAGSAPCGACAKVKGHKGEVTVRIVDRCPECLPGDIDLSPQAFEQIADLSEGRVDITWTYVECPVQGNIAYHFKDGSNIWWTAVQVRNHRYAIAKFEYLDGGGQFKEVPRLEYNFFVESSGMGEGPYTFRVTDVHGHVLQDSGITGGDNIDVPGAGQFPSCGP